MADLISLSEYKDFEGIVNTTNDTRLTTLVTWVSELVKTYCGSSLIDNYASPITQEITNIYPTSRVMLSDCPINTITSVKERSAGDTAYGSALVEGTDYYLDTTTDTLVRLLNGLEVYWETGFGAVEVIYTAGFSETPKDLLLAVVDIITYYFKNEYKEKYSMKGSSIENSKSPQGTTLFPAHITRVLDLYKAY